MVYGPSRCSAMRFSWDSASTGQSASAARALSERENSSYLLVAVGSCIVGLDELEVVNDDQAQRPVSHYGASSLRSKLSYAGTAGIAYDHIATRYAIETRQPQPLLSSWDNCPFRRTLLSTRD